MPESGRRQSWVVRLIAAAALAVAAAAVSAHENQERARALRKQGIIQPLENILKQARRQHPGRVIETELERTDRGYVYEIELVDQHGVVHRLRFDATTGRALDKSRQH